MAIPDEMICECLRCGHEWVRRAEGRPKNCPKCKQPDKDPDMMWLKLAGIKADDLKDKNVYKPRGCDYCSMTGFRGRIGIFEMMQMNNEMSYSFEMSNEMSNSKSPWCSYSSVYCTLKCLKFSIALTCNTNQ